MSFEGYYQVLCENGHLHFVDVYDFPDTWICSCGKKAAWKNMVDQTNNEDEGAINLEVEQEAVICICEKCKVEHIAKEVRYKIPEKDVGRHFIG